MTFHAAVDHVRIGFVAMSNGGLVHSGDRRLEGPGKGGIFRSGYLFWFRCRGSVQPGDIAGQGRRFTREQCLPGHHALRVHVAHEQGQFAVSVWIQGLSGGRVVSRTSRDEEQGKTREKSHA